MLKKLKRIFVLPFLFLTLGSSILMAQDSKLRGAVVDEDGNRVPRAKIILTLIARNHVIDFETNEKGKFYRRGIEPGEYLLTVKVEGFQEFSQKIYIKVGQEYKTEIILTKSATDKRVSNPEAKKIYDEAIQLYKQGKYREAIGSFERVIAIVPDFAEGYYNLGLTHLQIGNPDAAITMMEKAIELKKDFLEAYFGIGQAYMMKEEEDKAIEAFRKAITVIPDDANAYLNLGIMYFNYNKYDLALNVLLKALSLDKSLPQIHYQLGLVYIRKGEMDKAIERFETFLDLAPQAAEAEAVKSLLEEIER